MKRRHARQIRRGILTAREDARTNAPEISKNLGELAFHAYLRETISILMREGWMS